MSRKHDIDNLAMLARKPTHPGEVLREEFMPDAGLSVAQLAKAIGVTRQTVNAVVHERRAISPDMALRLARFFGTTPQYWLNMQRNVDIWGSLQVHADEIGKIEPLPLYSTQSAAVG